MLLWLMNMGFAGGTAGPATDDDVTGTTKQLLVGVGCWALMLIGGGLWLR